MVYIFSVKNRVWLLNKCWMNKCVYIIILIGKRMDSMYV